MPECFYYKGNDKINNITDIIDAFYRDTKQLKNAAIFSADDIQQSTVKIIRQLPGISSYEPSPAMPVTKFITESNSGFFAKIGVDVGVSGKLVPEYIEENRIYHYILDNLSELDKLPDDVNISGLTFTPEKFKQLRDRNDLNSISDNKLIYLLNKIEKTIEFEKKTTEFGTFLHSVISLKVKGEPSDKLIREFVKDPANKEIIGEFGEKEWFNKINDMTDRVLKGVKAIGLPLTEVVLTTDLIKGKLDLIAVDDEGVAHIFEIKISNTKYENWDSAKLLGLDWQLALYRQLLGQHLNVDKTQLYVIPIWVNNLGDPNAMTVDQFSNRNALKNSGLNSIGGISEKANKILPRKVITDYDPDRIKKLKDKLNMLLNGYTIQTDIEDYDIEKIINNARKGYEKNGKWSKYNNYENIPGLKKGPMEASNEADFRAMIEKYVAHVKAQVNQNVSTLANAITTAIKTGQPVKTHSYKPEKDITINHLVKEFLNKDWYVVDNIPEATAMGLIVLKNKVNGNVNIIDLSINQFYAQSKIEGTEDKLYGDLEYYKAMLFVNEFKDELFPAGQGQLAQVIVHNPGNNDPYYRNTFNKFKEFKELMYKKKMESFLKLNENDLSGIEDIAMYTLDTNLRNFSGSEKEKEDIEKIFLPIRDTNLDMADLNVLLDIQKEFYNVYPDYKNKSFKAELNFSDDKEVLFALLQTAIVSKSQMELTGDFKDISKFSLGFSDFASLLKALYTENQTEYDKKGRKIQGLVQGLVWTTPDWVSSKDLRNINYIMSQSNQHVGEKMVKASAIIHNLTLKYYKDINFSGESRNMFGETQSRYDHLWLHTDGKIDNKFRTKNPYIDDQENILTNAEKDYLQKMLLVIASWKYSITDEEMAKLDPSSLTSISSNPKIKKALDDGSYFEMPLIRKEEISRYKDAFTMNGKIWRDRIKPYTSEIRDYFDDRELQKEDLNNIQMQQMGLYEMYDVYGRQTPEFKAKMIERNGVDYFDLNLDTIAHRMAFNKIRKNIFDKQLPIINAYVWWMKYLAGKDNVDISDQLDYVAKQINLSVYDEPIIDKEFEDMTKTMAVVKKISTAAMLAFKPANMIKELTIGIFKGVSIAATKIYGKDQFGIKDLASAYKKLITIDNQFSTEFNLIDQVNHFYRFANMDVNTMSKKLQTDRHGLMRGTGRYMYICNTIPDYYNRLSLFLAKMIHDGSYDAHSLVNGELIYDPKKDKRFSYYLANRDKHVDSKGRYIPSKTDKLYNEQRQRYLLLIDQLQTEYRGVKEYTEKDLVDKAYSNKERSSLKSFTDMAYGYYDKDAQSQANNLWWGMAWLQFMQYWPGKMKQWFAKPTKESPMGHVEQEFVEDKDGNKILQWRKPILDENGDYIFDDAGKIKFELTSEDTGDPALKWTGTPYEGLMYSVIGTIKDVVTLDFKSIKNNEDRNRRFMFAITDAILIFVLLGLIKKMLDAIIDENGTEGLSGSVLNFNSAVNKKVLSEYNIYQSTLGAISTEPVFLSWGKKLSNDTWDLINGDKEAIDVLTRNVGAAEIFKW